MSVLTLVKLSWPRHLSLLKKGFCMTIHHVTTVNSVSTVFGSALTDISGPGSVLIDANAYLISEPITGGDGMTLKGAFGVTLNGAVGSFNQAGIHLLGPAAASSITVGSTGEAFGATYGITVDSGTSANITNHGTISCANVDPSATAIFEQNLGALAPAISITNTGSILGSSAGFGIVLQGTGLHTVNNSGVISGAVAISLDSGVDHLTNSGTLSGLVRLAGGADVFTDFSALVQGKVSGQIDLGNGNDIFNGGNNSESLIDNGGSDTMTFGGGDDVYHALNINMIGADGIDSLDGGTGSDLYDAGSANQPMLINLDAVKHFGIVAHSVGSLETGIETIINFDRVQGGKGDDYISGSAANNVLNGGFGGDGLYGQAGNDILQGVGGDDELTGGLGADVLSGGTGLDTFIYLSAADSGIAAATRDTITDFQHGLDTIDLAAIDAKTGTPATNDAFHLTAAAGLGAFTHSAGELHFGYTGTGTLLSADVNGDGVADFSILFSGHLLLKSVDFTL